MTHASGVFGRLARAFGNAMRKRFTASLLLLFTGAFTIIVFSSTEYRLPREEEMGERLANIHAHLHFLDSLYQSRQEDLIALQNKFISGQGELPLFHPSAQDSAASTTISPEVAALLKNLSGSKAAAGLNPRNLQLLRAPFVYQLLPHLMNDPNSLRPAFHMKAGRNFADVVLGIPTVKRDKENYLMITLEHLVKGLTQQDINSTLIVIFIGETDLEYVLNTARLIETRFRRHVENGLIEVISPAASYYPKFDALSPTLGDSARRFTWRTKQNLDNMYLMAYAQTKGTYYLMLEDDIIAKNEYMQDIKKFTAETTMGNPHWFFIEYCPIGGIGKLFKSSELLHFITYVQLFYTNLPIDWLLESYLADKVCTIDKTSKNCGKSKLQIRPKYKTSLFQHIGLYSSLKGKIQKIKDKHFGAIPTFYPHQNPPIESIRTDIEQHSEHSLLRAYNGETFFWGIKPKKGDVAEFWFQKPTAIERYTFRSSNAEHVSDRFYDTTVEVLPLNGNFTPVGTFDEFGLADGRLQRDLGPLRAIRLRVNSDSGYWVILSEIELLPYEPVSKS